MMSREKLIEAGIDYDEGVNRFAGKPALYEKYLAKLFEGTLMEELQGQLDAKDYEKAFRTAHDLKGMSGNLSVNQFYRKICELVELLRQGEPSADPALVWQQAKDLYQKAKTAVQD